MLRKTDLTVKSFEDTTFWNAPLYQQLGAKADRVPHGFACKPGVAGGEVDEDDRRRGKAAYLSGDVTPTFRATLRRLRLEFQGRRRQPLADSHERRAGKRGGHVEVSDDFYGPYIWGDRCTNSSYKMAVSNPAAYGGVNSWYGALTSLGPTRFGLDGVHEHAGWHLHHAPLTAGWGSTTAGSTWATGTSTLVRGHQP